MTTTALTLETIGHFVVTGAECRGDLIDFMTWETDADETLSDALSGLDDYHNAKIRWTIFDRASGRIQDIDITKQAAQLFLNRILADCDDMTSLPAWLESIIEDAGDQLDATLNGCAYEAAHTAEVSSPYLSGRV
jgi:hypothetical protein